jgi:cold shock CspA family protein
LRERGTVKWWNAAKGYGFLQRADGEDIFVHFSAIQTQGYRTLEEGGAVEFEATKGPKGLQATNVIAIGDRKSEEPPASPDLPTESEFLALTNIGGKLRLVSVSRDGYRFVDSSENLYNILYLYSSDTRALEMAVDELEFLMNDPNAKESGFQDFFERNPDFIKNDEYKAAHPHLVLSRDNAEPLIPDFVLQPVDEARVCDLLELKLPAAQIFVLKANRQRFSSAVHDACAQLREYAAYFDEERNRQYVEEKYGLVAYKPRMFVIIGRKGAVSPIQLRRIESDVPGLNLRTYDDVIARMKAKLCTMRHGGLR